jgi:hypothetical protein
MLAAPPARSLSTRLCIRNRFDSVASHRSKGGMKMPIHMGLAALLMSGAVQGEPATKLTLDADALSQPNGGTARVRARYDKANGQEKRGEEEGVRYA